MEYRTLGDTGINVSPIGLGTVKFGRNEGVKYPDSFKIPDEPFLADLLTQAKDLGINLLDTAPAYGQSEERLGRLLKGQRQDWVIIGKAGEEFENGQSHYDFTPEHFERSLERSLERLQTDYLDVFLIHSDGQDLNILHNANLVERMVAFREQGLVKAIGASTKMVEGGLKALELFDVVMCTYNPSYTDEKPVLDAALEQNKGVLLKKVLGSGHLTQSSSSSQPSSWRKPGSMSQHPDPMDPAVKPQDDNDRGKNLAKEALSFALSHKAVCSAIIGTINPEHLKENAATLSHGSS